ncbi:MAG TPA: hypothetical protein VF957_00160, partial [Bradyrhizobium sp.]
MRLEWMASSQALLAMTAVCTFWRQISHQKNKNGVSGRGVLARPVVECHAKGACQMAKMIFINLPVSNLARATAFYQAVGAEK